MAPRLLLTTTPFFLLVLVSSFIATTAVLSYYIPKQAIAQQLQPATTTNFLSYQNSTLGIKMQYPSDWEVVPAYVGSSRLYFFISSLSSTGAGTLGPKVYVDVFKNMPLDKLLHMVTPVPSTPPILNGTVKSTPGTFKGNPSYQLLFDWTETRQNKLLGINSNAQSINLSNMEFLITKDNNTSYLVAYVAERADYDKYLPIVQQMINSFEITNPPAQSVPEDSISPQCVYVPANCI